MTLRQKEDSTSYFKTFEYKGREVTISLVITEEGPVVVGYSILNPQDEFDSRIAAKISTGRALKESSRITEMDVPVRHQNPEVMHFILDKTVEIIRGEVESYIPTFSALPKAPIKEGDWVVVLEEDKYYCNSEAPLAQKVCEVVEPNGLTNGYFNRTYYRLKFSNVSWSNSYKKVRRATEKEIPEAKSRSFQW